MPDISMCIGTPCPRMNTCYRYTATPNPYWQAYFVTAPLQQDGNCDYYWELSSNDHDKSDNRGQDSVQE